MRFLQNLVDGKRCTNYMLFCNNKVVLGMTLGHAPSGMVINHAETRLCIANSLLSLIKWIKVLFFGTTGVCAKIELGKD